MDKDKVQERSHEIINFLGEESGWVSRAELAGKLGRRQLNPTDLSALTALEIHGTIEVDRRDDPRPAGVVYFYRLVQRKKDKK